jgi:hypothetical protein
MSQAPPTAGCSGFGACTITWSAWLSPGVVGSSPSYTMPDLSRVPGWSHPMELVAGTVASGDVTAITSSAGVTDFPLDTPAAGTQRVLAHTLLSITP